MIGSGVHPGAPVFMDRAPRHPSRCLLWPELVAGVYTGLRDAPPRPSSLVCGGGGCLLGAGQDIWTQCLIEYAQVEL